MALLDISVAMAHVRVRDTTHPTYGDLVNKLAQAEALVIHYLKRPDHGWTVDTDPEADLEFGIVQAAILKVLGNLYRFRGDDEQAPTQSPMTEDVKAMLSMLRDPTLA